MRKKTLFWTLFPLLLVLLIAVVSLMMLYAGQLRENRSLREENQALETERQALQARADDLAQELDAARTERDEVQSALDSARQESQTLQEQVEEMSRYTMDVRALHAGTVVEEREIDRQNLDAYFVSDRILEGDEVYARISGKSYVENKDIALEDLRYLKVLHYNFDHEVQVGELIVNAALAHECCEIFQELFENQYEIYSMYLIDDFWTGDGDTSDSASIDRNNTSAFCYRRATGSSSLSNHAFGRAIDINPQQNPYVSYRSGEPRWSHGNADDYIDRTTGYEHIISHDDLCYQIFAEHGFEWGGDWKTIKDYQHFEKEG